MMGYFQLHEHLSQYPGPLAEEVQIPRKLGLAQQIRECHPEIVGHRCVFSFRVFGETTKNENHTMADVVNGLLPDLHTHRDSIKEMGEMGVRGACAHRLGQHFTARHSAQLGHGNPVVVPGNRYGHRSSAV